MGYFSLVIIKLCIVIIATQTIIEVVFKLHALTFHKNSKLRKPMHVFEYTAFSNIIFPSAYAIKFMLQKCFTCTGNNL